MDFSWFLLLVSAAIFISIVLLVVICLDCRNKGSIPQTDSEEYMQPGFRVIHPSSHSLSSDWPTSRSLLSGSISAAQPTPPPNPVIITLSPDPHLRGSNSTKPLHSSYTPTGETESNPSYENPAPDPEDERDDPGYIVVLPDEVGLKEPKGAPPETHSRSSTPSSDHNYENIEAKKPNEEEDDDDDDDDEEESSNYENVQPGQLHFATDPMLHLSGSAPSSDDEYEDNYVNQPMGLVNNL